VAARVKKTEINGHGDLLRWTRDIVYSQKLALTSPSSGGRAFGLVHLRTKAREFSFLILGMMTQSDMSKVEDPVRGKTEEMQTFIILLSLFTVEQMSRDNLYVNAERVGAQLLP
jgi:hypothetical protein